MLKKMASKLAQQQDKMVKDDKKLNTVSADFNIGDHILCYEPDASKAKMLYEAKVLEIDVTKDDKGRKVPEYFIHFIGWNKSWDRWVLGESVLEDSDVNRQLQKTLYEKAMGTKKKWKFQKQKQDVEIDSIETVSQSNQSTANSSHAEGDQSPDLPFVSINIPNILKSKLEDDCYYIKRKKKLLKLPRRPNAVDILNDYLKHCEMVESNDNQGLSQNGTIVNIEIVREVVEGLLTYLNFTLSTLLLYNFEKEQYDSLFTKERIRESVNDLTMIAEVEGVIPSLQVKESGSKKAANKRKIKRCDQVEETKDGVSEIIPLNENFEVLKPVLTRCADNGMQPTQRKRGRPCGKRKIRGLPAHGQRPSARRETRATTQDLAWHDEKEMGTENSGRKEPTGKLISGQHGFGEVQKEVAGQKLEREVSEKIGSHGKAKNDSKEEIKVKVEVEDKIDGDMALDKDNGSFIRSLRPRRPISAQSSVCFLPNDSTPDQYSLPIGASACSMEKSNMNATKMGNCQEHKLEPRECSFISFPITAINSMSPAEVYGVEHLLRLFVKLPSILARSELDSRKRVVLIQYLEMFLRYLAERANGLFDKEHYSEPVI